MISLFPKFKKLEPEDRKKIEEITKQYPPYSDFNFVSLYCWNTDKNTKISLLYGNLIVKMKDYSGRKNLYSFMGNSKIQETIDILCKKIDEEKFCTIKLVPEANFIHNKKHLLKFNIKEDRDQFDYIYNILSLSKLSGSAYGKKRNQYRKFEKKYKSSIDTVNLNDKHIQKLFLELFNVWKFNKLEKKGYEHELTAIKRCFELAYFKELTTFGLYEHDNLIGFSINNILPYNYAYTIFEKSDNKYLGASEYLMKKKAEILYRKGCRLLNYAQDLGIPGLRKAKESWRPIKYLKKYIISPKDNV